VTDRAPSLQGRLVGRVLLLVVLVVIGTAGGFVFFLQSTVDTLRDRSLQGQAQDIAGYLAVAEDGRVRLELPAELSDDYASSDGDYVYVVADHAGTIVAASEGLRGMLAPPVLVGDADFFQLVRGGRVFYGVSLPVSRGGRQFVVQVAQGPAHADVLEDSLVELLIDEGGWILPLFVVLLLSLIALTIRSSVQPLIRASEQAGRIGPATTDVRLPVEDVPKEALPLVQAVNAALDRLAEGFRQQREFTANAAHELRTPLAVLRARLDTLPELDRGGELRRDIDRMGRIVSQLLKIAQLEQLHLRPDDVADLAAIAGDVAGAAALAAIEAGRTIEVRGGRRNLVFGNADAIFQAARNLVENALDHTPAGTAVVVDASRPGELRVSDAGPGVAPGLRARIFERFWRAPERQGASGAGLGLSIVASVMRMHGGAVTVEDAAGGGALFRLIFRAAAPAEPTAR